MSGKGRQGKPRELSMSREGGKKAKRRGIVFTPPLGEPGWPILFPDFSRSGWGYFPCETLFGCWLLITLFVLVGNSDLWFLLSSVR
jgi:hypothetical protein